MDGILWGKLNNNCTKGKNIEKSIAVVFYTIK